MHYRWSSFDELSAAQAYELLAFRQAVFIVEQNSAYQDLDGKDPSCWHLMVREWPGGPLAACARVRGAMGDDPAFIGRFVVAPAHRGSGLGRRVVAEALRYMLRNHPGQDIRLSAQIHLEAFYASFGFVAEGEPYSDGGIPHLTMWRRVLRPEAMAC